MKKGFKLFGIKISKTMLFLALGLIVAYLSQQKKATKTTGSSFGGTTGTGGTTTGGTTGTGGTGTEGGTGGTGTTVASFAGIPASVVVEMAYDTFSPEKFSETVYPTYFDANLGMNLPNWIVTLHTDLSKVYIDKSVDMRKRGIFGSVDSHLHNVEGTEWNHFINPDTGQPYPNNYNTRKNINLNTWSSSLPLERKLQASSVELNDWDTASEQTLASRGQELVRSTEFGDWYENGKKSTGLVNMDWENNYEGGFNPRKALRFIKSACDNLKGIFQAMYLHPLNSDLGYLTENGYPQSDGTWNPAHINPIFTSVQNLDGINYKAFDSANLAPLLEMSHYGETCFEGFFDGVRNLTAYGSNANIEHYLARVVSHAEKNFAYWNANGKDLIFIQDKMICDRGASGWKFSDGNRKGGGAKNTFSQYLTRDMAFKSTMAVFFSGCHKHEWNRPKTGINADCYNGFQFALNLLGTKKTLSGGSFSAVDMRVKKFADFALWSSQYKFAGETQYRKEKGYQLKDNKDNLLVRTMRLGSKVAILVINPYNVATKFDLTVAAIGGGYHLEKTFNSTNWQSCYPAEPTRKDYIFDIFDMQPL